jgi:hypothetical protein
MTALATMPPARTPARSTARRSGVRRIVSGGQSGVDRAALDVALARGIPCGGWCPRGRRAEDGPLPPRYPLTETPSAGYAERTTWNVRDSDGTLILNAGRLSNGTRLTAREARALGRPHLLIPLDRQTPAAQVRAIRAWLREHRISTLNVAGPRESKRPGIYRLAAALLRALWQPRRRERA